MQLKIFFSCEINQTDLGPSETSGLSEGCVHQTIDGESSWTPGPFHTLCMQRIFCGCCHWCCHWCSRWDDDDDDPLSAKLASMSFHKKDFKWNVTRIRLIQNPFSGSSTKVNSFHELPQKGFQIKHSPATFYLSILFLEAPQSSKLALQFLLSFCGRSRKFKNSFHVLMTSFCLAKITALCLAGSQGGRPLFLPLAFLFSALDTSSLLPASLKK